MRNILLCAALVLSGCGIDTESGVTLNGFYGIVVDDAGDNCSPSEETRPTTTGFYDAGFGQLGQAFYVYVLIRNNLPNNQDPSAERLNTNDFLLEAVDVEIDNSGPWSFLNGDAQAVPVAANIRVGSHTFVPVPLIASTTAEAMVRGAPENGKVSPIAGSGSSFQLMLRVRARGKLLDGSDIKSNEMLFPVTVSNQGLIPEGPCPEGFAVVGCTLVHARRGDTRITAPVQSDGWTCVEVD